MSNVGRKGRSFEKIRRADLDRLSKLAATDRREFFANHADWAEFYEGRYIGAALCQGAALHFLFGEVGVQDFDVYSFFEAHPDRPWYAKRNKDVDLGDSRFGQSPDRPDFIGRRVDLLGRGIARRPGEAATRCIRRWVAGGRTTSARLLAKKAVVLLDPRVNRGMVVWPL